MAASPGGGSGGIVEYRGTEYYPIPTPDSLRLSDSLVVPVPPVVEPNRVSTGSNTNDNSSSNAVVTRRPSTGGGVTTFVQTSAAQPGQVKAQQQQSPARKRNTTLSGYLLPDDIPPPPELYVPYLHNIRISSEVLVHQPPTSMASRNGMSRPAPRITLQTELGTCNFHEVNKDGLEDLDPELQLTLPSWELRQPDDEELEESKVFEEEEAKWDDEYWKAVGKHREMLAQNPNRAPFGSAGNRRALNSSGGTGSGGIGNGGSGGKKGGGGAPPEDNASFQRGDSFRIDAKVPAAPTGPKAPVGSKQQHQTITVTKKPPLPAAATKSPAGGGRKTSSGGVIGVDQASDGGRSTGTAAHQLDSAASSARGMAKSGSGRTDGTPIDDHDGEPTTAPTTPKPYERGDTNVSSVDEPALPQTGRQQRLTSVPSLVLNDASLLTGRENPDVDAISEFNSDPEEDGRLSSPPQVDESEYSRLHGSSGGVGEDSYHEEPKISRGDRSGPAKHPLHRAPGEAEGAELASTVGSMQGTTTHSEPFDSKPRESKRRSRHFRPTLRVQGSSSTSWEKLNIASGGIPLTCISGEQYPERRKQQSLPASSGGDKTQPAEKRERTTATSTATVKPRAASNEPVEPASPKRDAPREKKTDQGGCCVLM